MAVLTTTTWYGGEQVFDGVYRHHIIMLSQHCINITIIVYLCEYISVINIAKIFASYNTYTLPCSTPCVSCGCIDIQPLEFDLGSMQLRTELFATNIFQHDKPLPADNVECYALLLMNLTRNYHPALLPQSPLVQTLFNDLFKMVIWNIWEDGQLNGRSGGRTKWCDYIICIVSSRPGMHLAIRNTDIRGWST